MHKGLSDVGNAKKTAFHRACENAFSCLIVILKQGKVAVVLVIQTENDIVQELETM